MSKGYIQMVFAFVLILVVFIIVNWYLSSLFSTEIFVSDVIADSYKMINAIEFAKLNAKQALKFSVDKTADDMKIDLASVASNRQTKQEFLKELEKNYDPDLKYSEVPVSVSVKALDIKNGKVLASLDISSSSEYRRAELEIDLSHTIDTTAENVNQSTSSV
jgi:hypothetical protein